MTKGPSKFQVILMIVFGACAVAGVMIFAFAVGGGANNSIGLVTIWGTFDEVAFNAVVRQAAEADSNLSGVRYEEKDPATYEQELTQALAAGRGPDIFLLRTDQAMRSAGQALPIPFTSLPAEQYQATFVQAADTFISRNLGGVLAVPMLADPLVLYWNKDLLAAAGYAKPPAYWDEVIPMATYVTGAGPDVNRSSVTLRDQSNIVKKSAIAFGEYENIDNAKEVLSALILQAGGQVTKFDTANHVSPALASGGNSTASDSALRFYTEFANPSKNDYSWNRALPNARTAFAANDVGLYVGFASEEALIRRTNPNLNFAVAPLPQIRGGSNVLSFAYVYGFAISAAGKRPTAASTVAYLLANTNLSAAFSTVYGMPSARRDVLAQKAQGNIDLFNRSAIIARSWIDPDPVKTDAIFRGMIENTTSGAAGVSESVQRADQELAHILRQ